MCWSLLLRTSLENNDSWISRCKMWLMILTSLTLDFCGNWPHLCKQMLNICQGSSNWTILCEWVMQNETDAGLKVYEIWLDLAYHYVISALYAKAYYLNMNPARIFIWFLRSFWLNLPFMDLKMFCSIQMMFLDLPRISSSRVCVEHQPIHLNYWVLGSHFPSLLRASVSMLFAFQQQTHPED